MWFSRKTELTRVLYNSRFSLFSASLAACARRYARTTQNSATTTATTMPATTGIPTSSSTCFASEVEACRHTAINRPFKIMYTPGVVGVCGARPWSLWGRCKRALASTYRGGAGALHAGIAPLRVMACECASCFDFFERLSRACLGELIDILTEVGKSREHDERVPLLTVFILAARCANAAARTLPGHMLVLGVTPAKMLSHLSCIVFICPEPVLANDRFSPER
jgi:hypothetical protein